MRYIVGWMLGIPFSVIVLWYVVAHAGTTASDILHLVDHVRDRVKERTGVALERELHIW